MGEYVNASIRFGGKLPAEKAPELIELLNEKRLSPDWGGSPVELEELRTESFFGGNDVNYGNLDELCSFAAENGLYYEYACDAGPEWDSQRIFYNPETGESREFIGENTEAITLTQIKQLGSYEAVLAYFDTVLPPFEIVGEYIDA